MLKVKSTDSSNRSGDITWDEIVKGQTGKYAGTTFGELSNSGKVSGTNLEKVIGTGALAASIIDELAKTGSINVNVAGFDNKD